MITQEEVKKLFTYKDGWLYWNRPHKSARGKYVPGDRAGVKHSEGYIQITINGRLQLAHRLIYLYHHGYLPKVLDHINGDKTDNRIENLRSSSQSQNKFNSKKYSNNTSGYKNVYNVKGKWRIAFKVNGKLVYYGLYENVHEAGKVAKQIRTELHKEFANHE